MDVATAGSSLSGERPRVVVIRVHPLAHRPEQRSPGLRLERRARTLAEPALEQLPIYRTLQLRSAIGPRVMPYLQPFILSPVARKARYLWRQRSWVMRGL